MKTTPPSMRWCAVPSGKVSSAGGNSPGNADVAWATSRM
jgi:hypothetical protein